MSQNLQVSLANWETVFREALADETLRSERLRAAALSLAMLIAVATYLAMTHRPEWFSLSDKLHAAFRDQQQIVLGLLGGAILYEMTLWVIVGRWLHRRARPHGIWRYANACVETCCPTLLIVVMVRAFGPSQGLVSVPVLLYLLLILLATLSLDSLLCLFVGVISTVAYIVVAYRTHDPAPAADLALIASPHHYIITGVVLLVCGGVAGFVASRIRRHLSVSLRTIEERNRAVSIFGQHVSPAVARKLLNQHVESTGELRHVCIMFLDIRNFSSFAARHEPAYVMDYLNVLFGRLIDVVNDNGGIINKFLGDGFMAVFGAPVDDDEHCRHAVQASLAILDTIEKMNAADEIPATRIGIGLHVGDAVTGNVGSQSRKEYTIIGDVVNTASRIEQATKQFNATLLASDKVCIVVDGDVVPSDQIEDLGDVELKGLKHPVHLFKLA